MCVVLSFRPSRKTLLGSKRQAANYFLHFAIDSAIADDFVPLFLGMQVCFKKYFSSPAGSVLVETIIRLPNDDVFCDVSFTY